MELIGEAPPLAADAKGVEQVVRSVQARFPDVPGEHIAEWARAEYERYATARIRAFIPVLVERALLLQLLTGEPSKTA